MFADIVFQPQTEVTCKQAEFYEITTIKPC